MKIKSFNAYRAFELFGYEMSAATKLIMLRSPIYTHTELQFGPQYDNISFSATMQDDAKCCRFKQIEYTHPERWDDIVIPVTEQQEKHIFHEAKRIEGQPYDLPGLLSFGSKLDIVKPAKDAWWCSECVLHLIKQVYPAIPIAPDEAHPTIADAVCRWYFAQKSILESDPGESTSRAVSGSGRFINSVSPVSTSIKDSLSKNKPKSK